MPEPTQAQIDDMKSNFKSSAPGHIKLSYDGKTLVEWDVTG